MASRMTARRRQPGSTRPGLSDAAIRRLARRGGVKRMAATIYPETRAVLKKLLHDVLRDATECVYHSRAKTMSVRHVIYAMRRRGTVLYGYPSHN